MGMTGLLQRGYFAMPNALQTFALTTYGWRLRFLRYGSYHRRVLAELLESQWYSAERIEADQLRRLNGLLTHAARKVPFYRDRGLPSHLTTLAELRTLPVLHKSEVREHQQRLVSEDEPKRGLEIHTGGTTGTPLNIRCNRASLQRNYAFFARLLNWAGVPRGGRVATFAGRTLVPPDQSQPPFWRMNFAANALLMSSYHLSTTTIDAYLERLRTFQPALIDSYPSSLEPLARRILALGPRAIRPRAIVTSSETLFPSARQLLEDAFGCRVFDYYGGGEMAAFLSQCEAGSYHVHPEFGIIEILRDGVPVAPGETGEIVATGFVNPVMPLIRYATGDLAVQGTGRCSCGRAFPVIEQIQGRVDDVVITPEGRRIGRLDPIFKSSASILEARIVQDANDHVRLEVVPAAGYSPASETVLVQELSRRLGPSMRVDVVQLPSIPRQRSGKLRMVVREIAS
jgi:phenylacetate-CoA ligase